MREILFRGYSNSLREWVYGHYITDIASFDSDNLEHMILTNSGCITVDGKTIGQFTGLKDIKGRDIYDGDILHYGYYTLRNSNDEDDMARPINFPVRYSQADGGWVANGRLIDWDKDGIYKKEKIGTIYDDERK